jgi:hypothetical protein
MFKGNVLSIYWLDDNHYRLSSTSSYFPTLQIHSIVEQYRQIAYAQSSSQAIRQLRQQFS